MKTPILGKNPELAVVLLGKAEKAGYQRVLLKVRELDEEQVRATASPLRDPANKRDFAGELMSLMSQTGRDLVLTVPDSMTKKDICDDFLRTSDGAKKTWGRMVVLSIARGGQIESPKCVACEQSGSGPFEHCFTMSDGLKGSMGCATCLKRYHDAGQDECIRCSFEK